MTGGDIFALMSTWLLTLFTAGYMLVNGSWALAAGLMSLQLLLTYLSVRGTKG